MRSNTAQTCLAAIQLKSISSVRKHCLEPCRLLLTFCILTVGMSAAHNSRTHEHLMLQIQATCLNTMPVADDLQGLSTADMLLHLDFTMSMSQVLLYCQVWDWCMVPSTPSQQLSQCAGSVVCMHATGGLGPTGTLHW